MIHYDINVFHDQRYKHILIQLTDSCRKKEQKTNEKERKLKTKQKLTIHTVQPSF